MKQPRWWQDKGRFVIDDQGNQLGWQGIILDITETKRLEEQLMQSQKLESVGRLAGHGIDDSVRQHIFEPFFTTKEVGRGTGLGLATVYGIVKQSGGNIEVESREGVGTTFRIYLPRVEDESEAAEVKNTSTESLTGTETILLVEDEELVRNLSREILETCGYTVIEAQNGLEALEVCENGDCKIDLLLTDVVMPQMGGRELAEKLTEKLPNIQILFTSGYADNAMLNHGVTEISANFIQKPFTFDALARKVRELLDAEDFKAKT